MKWVKISRKMRKRRDDRKKGEKMSIENGTILKKKKRRIRERIGKGRVKEEKGSRETWE